MHLLLDDEYQITTSTTFWAEHYLPDGTEISEDDWQRLVQQINERKALNKAVELLSHRDHSAKELRDKLLRTADWTLRTKRWHKCWMPAIWTTRNMRDDWCAT